MQWAVLDIFLEIKIFGAVLVGAVLAMGRFGIDPFGQLSSSRLCVYYNNFFYCDTEFSHVYCAIIEETTP